MTRGLSILTWNLVSDTTSIESCFVQLNGAPAGSVTSSLPLLSNETSTCDSLIPSPMSTAQNPLFAKKVHLQCAEDSGEVKLLASLAGGVS